jgi:hypothetical protein
MPIAVGAAAVWFFFFRGKKAAADTKPSASAGDAPPPELVARAVSGWDTEEDKAAAQQTMTELWYAGVLDADGRVLEYVEGVTHDPEDGAPVAVPGETMESYTDRALGWQQATGQQVLLPF